MKRSLIFTVMFILFCITSILTSGENVKIVTKKGEVYYGKTELYKNASEIKLKSDDKKKSLIPSKDIAYMLAWGDNQDSTNSYRFVYTQYNYVKHFSEKDCKLTKNGAWIVEIDRSKNIILYQIARGYGIGEDGNLFLKGSDPKNDSPWMYLMQRSSEKYPTIIAYVSSMSLYDSYFIKMGTRYFEDCPEISNGIENKELKAGNIEKVMLLYDDCID